MAWSLVVAERDGTVVTTWSEGDDITSAPVFAHNGQDVLKDIGAGGITIPLMETDALDALVENRFLHLQIDGTTVASQIIGVANDVVRDEANESRELASYTLTSLIDLLSEGVVVPGRGFDVQPPGYDRPFDWSDPARDNSDATSPDELGSVTDADGNYGVLPYGSQIVHRDDVKVIGPAGSVWSSETVALNTYFYIDHDFSADAYYRFNGTGDNATLTVRIDGTEIVGYTPGFGQGWSVDKVFISAGTHRVAAAIQQTGNTGPTTLAMEAVILDAGDNDASLELVTDSSWGVFEGAALDHPPGMTVGKIGLTVLAENQALGAMTDITAGFDETNDSNGDPWAETWDITTKAAHTSVATFFLKELSETYCESRMTALDAGGARWDLYPLGGAGRAATFEIVDGTLRSMSIQRERYLASKLIVEHPNGFHLVTATPPAGQPVRISSLSLGSAQSIPQIDREATAQLDLFGRPRESVAIVDSAFDPLTTWTADTGTAPAARDMTPADARIVAVTWTIDKNGQMAFIPQFGDLIVPVDARASLATRKMAGGHMAGRSRVSSTVTHGA